MIKSKFKEQNTRMFVSMGASTLVTTSARSSVTFPLQTEQDLLEPAEIRGASTRAGNSLTLRVLQLDEVADAVPRGTRREGSLELREVLRFRVSMRVQCQGGDQESIPRYVLVVADAPLLLLGILFVELLNGALGLVYGLLTTQFRCFIASSDFCLLFLSPIPK